jgi:CRISPR-associated protein Csm3
MSKKLQLVDYWTLSGTLGCVTGLRIGGAAETIEIGGLDNPIIKHPITGMPYVPGSSLKGKMRSLLELRLDKIDSRVEVQGRRNRDYGAVHRPGGWNCGGDDCPICRIFGSNAGEGNLGPGRLIVRDAYLTGASEGAIQEQLAKGEPITEIKYENTINRITAMANPRQMERVPAGVTFAFEIGYRIFDTGDGGETDRELFQQVVDGLRMVEADALGGSGSRGYGRVAFEGLTLTSLETGELVAAETLEGLQDLDLP